MNSLSKLRIVFVFSILIHFVGAQTSGVKGKLINVSTGEALIAATIKSGEIGVITDQAGNYELRLAPGNYVLEFSYIGFEPVKKNITISSDEWLVQNISMQSAENILETAIISESRYSKPITASTISVEVIKNSLLEHLNSTSVESVLNKVPGIIMVGDQANIRGGAGYSYGAGSRVLLMINDVPALQADAGYSNWDDIPVENIEQIEVIKGAASAIYGSSALNGLVNVRTKYAKSEPITKISSYYLSVLPPKNKAQQWWSKAPYTSGINISHAQKMNRLDLVLGSFVQKSNSHNETSNLSYGRLNGSINYRFTDRFNAGFHFNINKRKSNSFFYWRDGVNAIYRPDSTTLSNADSYRFHVDPFITYFDKRNNRHALRSRIYVVNNNVSGGKSNSSTMYYNEYSFQRNFERRKLVLSAGLVDQFNESNSELFSRLPFRSDNKAIYTQVEKKIQENVSMTAGWRFEKYKLSRPEIFEGDTLPGGIKRDQRNLFRIGLNAKIMKGTFLRSSWGQGFRFPTLAELFIVTTFGSTNISPNPALQSENGWNTELGIKQIFLRGKSTAFVDAAVFWSRYDNMMEFVFTGFVKGFQSQNIGNTDIKGYELSVGGNTVVNRHSISIMGGYTYINPKFRNFTEEDNRRSSADFNILKYRSRHMLKLDLDDQIGKWTIGSGFLYSSKMEAIDAIFELVIRGLKDYRKTHGGYFTQDLRVARTVNKFTFNLIGKNIWNEEYTTRPAISEAPRNITLKIDYIF